MLLYPAVGTQNKDKVWQVCCFSNALASMSYCKPRRKPCNRWCTDGKEMTKEELALADDVAEIILQAFDTQSDKRYILIMFQTIARQVLHYQQSLSRNVRPLRTQILISLKVIVMTPFASGAQLRWLIKVREEQLKQHCWFNSHHQKWIGISQADINGH